MKCFPRKHPPKTKSKIFEATIYESTHQVKKGVLVQVTDSTVVMSQPLAFQANGLSRDTIQRIAYSDIRSIHVQRQNSIAKGAGIGFIFGAGAGLLAGIFMSSGSKEGTEIVPSAVGTFLTSLIGGVIGTLLGAIVGKLSYRTFHINGSQEKLMDMQRKMEGRNGN